MRIGITCIFQGSYFSGSIPQVAIALSRAFQSVGHDVNLLRLSNDPDWFIDVHEHKDKVPKRCVLDSSIQQFDVIIEVAWSLSSSDRTMYAKQVYFFMHYPPIFNDIESSVYMGNPSIRDFSNVYAIMTYDFYTKQDVQYIELLSKKPVIQIPYVWDNEPLDTYMKEANAPQWNQAAKDAERMIPAEIPKSMSWCARIVESNSSNTSSCIIPLNIVSVIRAKKCPIRVNVHSGTHTNESPFFHTNVSKNLLLPDISGAMVPRVRLPDLCRDKTVLIAHQRFRPIKSFLLDALYLGIPMIHNCAMVKQYGAQYYYELNQIQQATDQFTQLASDYENQKGFFAPRAENIRKAALVARFSPAAVASALNIAISNTHTIKTIIKPVAPIPSELRIAFANMWENFQPKHNFFMYLLSWVGKLNNIRVVHDDTNPNLVFFGPLSSGAESKYPGVPKVFFTGENAPKNTNKDTFLNLGFLYEMTDNYVRLPLWVLELNWWGADPEKVVNPKYVNLEDALNVNPSILDAKSKFCAFVATNPTNQNRNIAFQVLNNWQRVDSGGRLFCNLPNGPIPAGSGGGGGELAKIDFYKQYKFALTFENSSAPGYCTEKLFHAKVAGCVPIYWGDPFVDRDFDSKGFINVNQISTTEQLIESVKKIYDDPVAWRKMAEVPALSATKKRWCEKTMEQVAQLIFKQILKKEIAPIQESDWLAARKYASEPSQSSESVAISEPEPVPVVMDESKLFITAANAKYVEPALNAIASFRKHDKTSLVHVYVWDDVSEKMYDIFQKVGANEIRKLPTHIESETHWEDFWNPQHFAWKLWIFSHVIKTCKPNTSVLYMDSGVFITSPLDKIWNSISTNGVFILDDSTQTNRRWCHKIFCETLNVTESELDKNQIWAGCIGFRVGYAYNSIFNDAFKNACDHKDAIIGKKWYQYSDTCLGHRHDQSILSILSERAGCPRLMLNDFYCDVSLRAAEQYGTPLYVHRGNFKQFTPFLANIDEAYVINLERRSDRLASFKSSNPYMKDKAYCWKATDGRALQLTPAIIHCFRNNDFGWKKAVMGCALSHLGLWEKLANDQLAKSYLIMEDDVRFSPEWQQWWHEHASSMPSDADVVYLGGVLPPNKPTFPHIIDPVNPHFGRVKQNTFFGGSTARRYFHFCNYAYILTQRGAQKLVKLVKDRGIFTSGDHMIVNHGDDLLNIYFTTPLFATCFQENDPIYQTSDFNNFSRVDNFDSDLWNNTECFTKTEVEDCLKLAISGASAPAPAPTIAPAPAPTPTPTSTSNSSGLVPESTIQTWNTFLKAIALKQPTQIKEKLVEIFDIWETYTAQEINDRLCYFRILEQFVINDEHMLREHRPYILERIKSFKSPQIGVIFQKIRAHLEESKNPTSHAIPYFDRKQEKRINVYHIKEIDSAKLLEREWFDSVFPHPIEYKQFTNIQDMVQNSGIYLYQRVSGLDTVKLMVVILDMMRTIGKQLTIIHMSDEFAQDDISWYNHPSVKQVIRNYSRPDLKPREKIYVLPLGFMNRRSSRAYPPSLKFSEREHTWSFAGSMDREGRAQALSILTQVKPHCLKSKPTWSSPEKLGPSEYNEMIRKTKFVPCMRGSKALESFRLYEALEHGAIPIYVPSESSNSLDEYKEIFGEHPLLGFPNWETAADYLPKLITQPEIMENHRNELHKWWNNKKAEIRAKLSSIIDS